MKIMHSQRINELRHTHQFSERNHKGERRTRQVLALTLLTMLVEIGAGMVFGSMALLADGWHMATHTAAFMITLFAYRYARTHANDITFSFGSGKVSVLGGFTSAIVLSIVAVLMLIESGLRLVNPQTIRFDEAIIVAGLGLLVNMISAILLKDSHDHHDHTHDHHHDHHHHDHNLKAAYLHVLADALTSVLALIALTASKYYGLTQLDPAMGVIGGLIILRWSYGLVRETSTLLLDQNTDVHLQSMITETIERDADNRLTDIHLWRVAPDRFAVIVSVVSHTPQNPDYYKALLIRFHKLAHITIEVHHCSENDCH